MKLKTLLYEIICENIARIEQIANSITKQLCDELNTTPDKLMRGHCDTWAVAFKKVVPDAEIVETDVYSKKNREGNSPCHVFIKIGNLYFDAETPKGVKDPRDLPFFDNFSGILHLHKRGVPGTTHIRFPARNLKEQEYFEALAKFGLGPLYKPKPPKKYQCPNCKKHNATKRNAHEDTEMECIELNCPDCHYSEEQE